MADFSARFGGGDGRSRRGFVCLVAGGSVDARVELSWLGSDVGEASSRSVSSSILAIAVDCRRKEGANRRRYRH